MSQTQDFLAVIIKSAIVFSISAAFSLNLITARGPLPLLQFIVSTVICIVSGLILMEALRKYSLMEALRKYSGNQNNQGQIPDNQEQALPTCNDMLRASGSRNLELVNILLKQNPDLAICRDDEGITPLHYAVSHGDYVMAERLLANKAYVDARALAFHLIDLILDPYIRSIGFNIDKSYWTPLHIAVSQNYLDVTRLLLTNKADVNAKTSNDWTPLLLAVYQGYLDVVKVLLINKADVNTKDAKDQTPLHLAAFKGHKLIVELLLDYQDDMNARDFFDKTPLSHAETYGYHNIAELLRQHGGHR